jgi:hypothetical protein
MMPVNRKFEEVLEFREIKEFREFREFSDITKKSLNSLNSLNLGTRPPQAKRGYLIKRSA